MFIFLTLVSSIEEGHIYTPPFFGVFLCRFIFPIVAILDSHVLPQERPLENHVSGLKKQCEGDTCHGNIQKQLFRDLEEYIFVVESEVIRGDKVFYSLMRKFW